MRSGSVPARFRSALRPLLSLPEVAVRFATALRSPDEASHQAIRAVLRGA
jgi:hypothetical protein